MDKKKFLGPLIRLFSSPAPLLCCLTTIKVINKIVLPKVKHEIPCWHLLSCHNLERNSFGRNFEVREYNSQCKGWTLAEASSCLFTEFSWWIIAVILSQVFSTYNRFLLIFTHACRFAVFTKNSFTPAVTGTSADISHCHFGLHILWATSTNLVLCRISSFRYSLYFQRRFFN